MKKPSNPTSIFLALLGLQDEGDEAYTDGITQRIYDIESGTQDTAIALLDRDMIGNILTFRKTICTAYDQIRASDKDNFASLYTCYTAFLHWGVSARTLCADDNTLEARVRDCGLPAKHMQLFKHHVNRVDHALTGCELHSHPSIDSFRANFLTSW